MSLEHWQRLQQIFWEAEEKQGAERAALLDRACAGDEEMRRSVESMLESEGTCDFLHKAVGQAATGLSLSIQQVQPGQAVGAYRIVRQLGSGGMGDVYLAQRSDQQFDKQIAIKLMRAGLDTPDLRARFRAERQILARLEHPNIARLLDGGALENGLPYVAMEYVEGVPVTEYVRTHELSIRQRIELFLSICEAVEYAHRNLVVHRDIKPANILVTPEGVAKLLDFGIARLVSADATSMVGVTRLAERLMTPEYASPEQVRCEPVTTATDVYSLGVLLYLLLAGRPPYVTEGLTPSQVERVICEDDPERPSSAVLSAGLPPDVARHFHRETVGDLDQIVSVAMRKDPTVRYGSAGQLIEDLRRYLDGYPVAARKGAWTYATSKFIRRHRAGVIAAAAFLVVIVGFAIGMAVLERKIRLERDAAEADRRAEQQVSSFLVNLFQVFNTDESRGHPLTARELLDQGVVTVNRDLSSQPQLHARLLATMGNAYESLGVYSVSEPLLAQSLAIRRSIGGGHTLAVAESLKNLAETYRLRSKFPEAEAAARESLAIRQSLLGPENIEVAESLNTLGLLLTQKGDPSAGEPFVRQALTIRTKLEGSDSLGAAVYMSNLGGILRNKNDLAGAELNYRTVVDLRRRKMGDHPRTALAMNGLGLVLLSRAKYSEAETLLHQTIELRRKLLGENHPDVFVTTGTLAAVFQEQGKYKEAEDLWKKALAFNLAHSGEAGRETAICLNGLGSLAEETGKYSEALALNRRALESRRSSVGEHSIWYARSLADTAKVLLDRGDLNEANALATQSLDVLRQTLGTKNMETASSMGLLGRIAARRHDFQSAASFYNQALEADTAVLDRDHPRRAEILDAQGALLLEEGKPAEAEPLLREALAIRQHKIPGHWATFATSSRLGASLTAQRRFEDARPFLITSVVALDPWRSVRPREAAEAKASLETWRVRSKAAQTGIPLATPDTAKISPAAVAGRR